MCECTAVFAKDQIQHPWTYPLTTHRGRILRTIWLTCSCSRVRLGGFSDLGGLCWDCWLCRRLLSLCNVHEYYMDNEEYQGLSKHVYKRSTKSGTSLAYHQSHQKTTSHYTRTRSRKDHQTKKEQKYCIIIRLVVGGRFTWQQLSHWSWRHESHDQNCSIPFTSRCPRTYRIKLNKTGE